MCEICINRSCSKAEILLRRTDTFGPVCFVYAFLSPISKAKTLRRTLPQTDNFFQSSNKHVTCFTPTRIKLDIFVKFLKEKDFFTLQNNNNFFDFILFIKCDTFESNSVCFFLSCSLQPTNSCFVSLKAISDRDLQTIHHPSMNYWFQYCDLIKFWWSVKDLHKNALKISGTRSPVDILTSDKNLVFFYLFILFSPI